MKKLIAAIVIASVGAAFADPTLVYDYKASIKRLDIKLRFDSKAKLVAEKYNVASDTITGFVTLPKCQNCEKSGIDATADADAMNFVLAATNPNAFTPALQAKDYIPANASVNPTADSNVYPFSARTDDFRGYAYLVLNGNKLVGAKYSRYRRVLKTSATANGAVFGAETYTDGNQKNTPLVKKQLTKAWMALDFVVQDNYDVEFDENGEEINHLKQAYEDLDGSELVKSIGKDPEHPLYLGFYGATNAGNWATVVENTGFGTAKVDPGTSDYTICGTDSTADCLMINTISGSLVGYPYYIGPCNATPMWDVCDINSSGVAHEGVISGTWTLKFNASLSKLGSFKEKEDQILKKLKGDVDGRIKLMPNGKVYGIEYKTK